MQNSPVAKGEVWTYDLKPKIQTTLQTETSLETNRHLWALRSRSPPLISQRENTTKTKIQLLQDLRLSCRDFCPE